MARNKPAIPIPECCKNCVSLTPAGTCGAEGKDCFRWRAWFSKEWARIRKAAAILKGKEIK